MQYISENEEEQLNQTNYLKSDKYEEKNMIVHSHKHGFVTKEKIFPKNKFLKKEQSQPFLRDKTKNSFLVAKPKSKSQRNTVNDNSSKYKTLTRDISQNELPIYNNMYAKQNKEKEKKKEKENEKKKEKEKENNESHYKVKKDKKSNSRDANNQTMTMIQTNPPTNFFPYSSHGIALPESMFHQMQLGSPSPMNIHPNIYPMVYNPVPMNVYPIPSPINPQIYYPNVYAGPSPNQCISNYPSTIHSQYSSAALCSHQSSAAGYGLNQFVSPQPIINCNGGMNNFFPYTSPTNFISTVKQPFITYQVNTMQSTFNTQSNGHGYGYDTNSNNVSRPNISHISEDLLINPNNSSVNTSQLNITRGDIHPNKTIQQENHLQKHKYVSNNKKDKIQSNILTNMLNEPTYKRNKSQHTIYNKNIPELPENFSLAQAIAQIPNQNIFQKPHNIDQFTVNGDCRYESNIFSKLDKTNSNKENNVHRIEQQNNYNNQKYGLLLDNKSKSTSNSAQKSNYSKSMKPEKDHDNNFGKKILISNNDNLSTNTNTNTNINSNNNASFQYKSFLNTNSIYKEEPSGCQGLIKFESFNSPKHFNIISTKDSSHLEIQGLGVQVSSKNSYETRESINKQLITANTFISSKEDQTFANTYDALEKIKDFRQKKSDISQITNEAKMSNYNSTSDSNPLYGSMNSCSRKAEKLEIIFNEPRIKNRKFNSEHIDTNLKNTINNRKFDSNRTSISSKTVRVSVLVNEINLTNLESDRKISDRFSINFEGI